MGVIHRFKDKFTWEDIDRGVYPPNKTMQSVSVQWLIGPNERAPNFALRYFEIEPGGWTSLDRHAHDHGVFILRGQGLVLLDSEEHPIEFGDVVYIAPQELHQIKNTGDEPLGFLCVIPPKENRS